MKLYDFPSRPTVARSAPSPTSSASRSSTRTSICSKAARARPRSSRKNPNGRVPVLEDGDFVLWESTAIIRYLAGGSALIPRRRARRAPRWIAGSRGSSHTSDPR